MQRSSCAAAVLAVVAGCAQPQPPDVVSPKPFERTVIGGVVGISSTFGHVVDLDAQVEVVSSGYGWSEGPVWVNAEVGLLFSDVPGNTIYRWHPDSGTTLWLTPSGSTGSGTPGGEGGSNGLTLDAAGRLVLAQHGDRRVARLTGSLDMPAPQFETIIDAYEGQAFNSPNDLVYGSDGSLYFTDPTYGLAGPDEAELDFAGVYRLSIAGELTLIDGALTRPNGIALSPDGRTLYVANSDPGASLWMAYSVQADGHATDGRLFFDATHLVSEDNPGFPDGLSLDVAGRLFATGPGGVLVFSPEGEHLGTIRTDGPTANLAFGEDGTVLFLTSNSHLARIQTLTRGLGF